MTKWIWATPNRRLVRGQRSTNVAHAFLNGVSLCRRWRMADGRVDVVDFSDENGYKEVDYEDRRRCKTCMDRIAGIQRKQGLLKSRMPMRGGVGR